MVKKWTTDLSLDVGKAKEEGMNMIWNITNARLQNILTGGFMK